MRSSSSEDHRDRGARVRLVLVVALLVAAAAAPVVGRTSAVLTDHDAVELRVTVVTATPSAAPDGPSEPAPDPSPTVPGTAGPASATDG
jgi:hypothetical protein